MAKIMTKKEFNKFIDNIYYRKVSGSSHYDYCRTGNVVTVFNRYNNKSGIARCDTADTFQIEFGVALAYCRMKGIEFPKVKTIQQVRINTLKSGDVFSYLGNNYTFLAKHPNKDFYYILRENSDEVVGIYSATVSIEKVD